MKKLYQAIYKATEYLFYLFLVILPFQTRWIFRPAELNGGYFEYGTASLYFSDVYMVSLLFLILILRYFENIGKVNYFSIKKTKIESLWLLIGGFEMVVFISCLLSSNMFISFYAYTKIILGITIFWIYSNLNYSKRKLIWFLLASLFIQSVLGISQFKTGLSPASTILGMAEHNALTPGISVVEAGGDRFLRAYGSFDHPNIFGGFLVLSLLILFLYFIASPGIFFQSSVDKNRSVQAERDSVNFYRKKYTAAFFIVCVLLAETVLFFTFSRAAWISFVVGLAIFLILSVIRRDLLIQKKVLYIILFSGILFYSLYFPYNNLVSARFFQSGRIEQKSINERINFFGEAKDVISDKWLTGIGVGNYTNYIYEELDDSWSSWQYQPVHNVFLLVWAELGIFGLLFFIGIIQVFFSRQIHKLRNKKSYKVYGLAILIPLVIFLMMDHWLWTLNFGVLWFWLVLGLL